MLRTAESEKKAARFQEAQGVEVEELITARGCGDVRALQRQRWRIENHEIKFRLAPLEIRKGICFENFAL